MAAATATTSPPGRHRPRGDPVAVLRLPGRGKEQNGAAMSLGRTSTFLDIYLQRDLADGRSTEQRGAGTLDDFVIKLRIIRFLRTPEYDELFSGDPTWITESIGGIGRDGRPLVTRTCFRYLQTLYNLGPAPDQPDRPVVARRCRRASNGSAPRSPSTPAPSSTNTTTYAPALQRRHRDRLLRLGHAGRQADGAARLWRAAHHGLRHRRPIGHRRLLSAVRYATVRPARDDTGLVTGYVTEGEFPAYGNDDDRADEIAVWLVRAFMDKLRQRSTSSGSPGNSNSTS